ncbi:ATP-dependent DNA helicase PIF1, partial [Trifolium medium]|nr:ATP-dependent DNA helicase PIF1 [Trifolium medium]
MGYPTRFVYNKDRKAWRPRETGYSIGRLNYTPPGVGQLYYMRILLTRQCGCTSFRDIRTVNDHVYDTYQVACDALRLLDDDKEFIGAINEVGELASGQQLRRMFAMLLFMNTMSNPVVVWKATWRLLADGILYHKRRELNISDLNINDEDLKILCLVEIQMLLCSNGTSLDKFKTMPFPEILKTFDYSNKLIAEALNYDKEEMAKLHDSLIHKLTDEQADVYKQIMDSVLT